MEKLIEAEEDLKSDESMSLPNIVTKRMARFFMDSASASSANGNLLDLGLDSETILTVRSTYIILRPKIGSKIFLELVDETEMNHLAWLALSLVPSPLWFHTHFGSKHTLA